MKSIPIPKEELERLAKEKTQAEIAKIYRCRQDTISDKMKKYNISTWEENRREEMGAKNGMKKCNVCRERKKVSEFHRHSLAYDGYAGRCKKCVRIQGNEWRERRPQRAWATAALGNHRRQGHIIAEELTIDWLEDRAKETKKCPICEKDLVYRGGDRDNAASFDRKDNEEILNRDNIWIICWTCNVTKLNRTFSEFVDYCKMIVGKYGG